MLLFVFFLKVRTGVRNSRPMLENDSSLMILLF
jgi:hypothetical protein